MTPKQRDDLTIPPVPPLRTQTCGEVGAKLRRLRECFLRRIAQRRPLTIEEMRKHADLLGEVMQLADVVEGRLLALGAPVNPLRQRLLGIIEGGRLG